MCVVLDFAPQRWRHVLCWRALSGTPSTSSDVVRTRAKCGGTRGARRGWVLDLEAVTCRAPISCNTYGYGSSYRVTGGAAAPPR
jgi:hypothetical protein